MKRYRVAILLVCGFGCSKGPNGAGAPVIPAGPPPTEIVAGQDFPYDADQISFGSKLTAYVVSTYYTSIDTLADRGTVYWPLNALINDGDSLSIAWTINSKRQIRDVTYRKVWDSARSKWSVYSIASVDMRYISGKLPIKANLTYANPSNTLVRESTLSVTQKRFDYDLFRVNFGMDKTEVKANESVRLSPNDTMLAWKETSPHTAVIGVSSNSDGFTYYEFKNNRLTAVSETILTGPLSSGLIDLAKRLRIPAIPELEWDSQQQRWVLDKEQTWTNGKIKFTIHYKDFQLNAGAIKNSLCITYEKM